jgi:hypothetical protein
MSQLLRYLLYIQTAMVAVTLDINKQLSALFNTISLSFTNTHDAQPKPTSAAVPQSITESNHSNGPAVLVCRSASDTPIHAKAPAVSRKSMLGPLRYSARVLSSLSAVIAFTRVIDMT